MGTLLPLLFDELPLGAREPCPSCLQVDQRAAALIDAREGVLASRSFHMGANARAAASASAARSP